MKIGSGFGNNINFIEQKTTISQELKNQNSPKTVSSGDSFFNSSLSTIDIMNYNDNLGMLQVSQNSLQSLKEKNKKLQGFAEQFEYHQENKVTLEKEFESVIEEMFDVVDKTIYNNQQLFYTNMSFSKETAMPSFMLSEFISIEDLSLEQKDSLVLFDKKIESLSEEITKAKEYVQLVSFNALAASSCSLENIKDFSLSQKSEPIKLNKEEMQRAHDMNSLMEKATSLLRD